MGRCRRGPPPKCASTSNGPEADVGAGSGAGRGAGRRFVSISADTPRGAGLGAGLGSAAAAALGGRPFLTWRLGGSPAAVAAVAGSSRADNKSGRRRRRSSERSTGKEREESAGKGTNGSGESYGARTATAPPRRTLAPLPDSCQGGGGGCARGASKRGEKKDLSNRGA